jgi:hypothetical protein
MDREVAGQTNPTPCISTLFIETFTQDRMYEQSPQGSKLVDLSAENFFKLTSVMKWANAKKDETRKNTEEIDATLIKRVTEEHAEYKKEAARLDKVWPNESYSKKMPARFALLQLLRLLTRELKQFTLKKGDGRDLCHAAIGTAYGSIAALDKQWKRRVEALPTPNGLARVYSPNELDQFVTDLETASKQTEARRNSKP